MDVSVHEAAERLKLDPSRVRRLIRSGELAGYRIGRSWVVDGDALALAASRSRPAGRPLSPLRAWGALDLLAGDDAPWLSAVARSQVRALIRGLATSSSDRWRAALRGRCDRHPVVGHSASIRRLVDHPSAVASGPGAASAAGLDLIAPSARPEVYVDQLAWKEVPLALHLREEPLGWMALVRVVNTPQLLERLRENPRLRSMAVAADCLEDADPRAVRAGWDFISRRADELQTGSK